MPASIAPSSLAGRGRLCRPHPKSTRRYTPPEGETVVNYLTACAAATCLRSSSGVWLAEVQCSEHRTSATGNKRFHLSTAEFARPRANGWPITEIFRTSHHSTAPRSSHPTAGSHWAHLVRTVRPAWKFRTCHTPTKTAELAKPTDHRPQRQSRHRPAYSKDRRDC
jgi:hypothetical protein